MDEPMVAEPCLAPSPEREADLRNAVLLPWRRLPFPLPWDRLFVQQGPLQLEIGFGDGRFTARQAAATPEGRFLGLEISSESMLRALRRLRRERLTNVRIAKVGALFALQHFFEPASLALIVVNFPDPWPKKRHRKNRLVQQRFFELAASRLVPGGAVHLATDHEGYLDFGREEALATGLFALEEPPPPRAVLETKYAEKWKAKGRPVFYRVFRSRGAGQRSFPLLERAVELPHARLQGTLPSATRFEKRVTPFADGHVILHEVAVSMAEEAGGRWLVRVTVDEPDLRQQLLVAVQPREGGQLLVRLEPFGDPLVTPAARGAVHAVTEWLCGLPGIDLLERSY